MSNLSNNTIITRFPPSPTGWFHVGNARTALFNYFYTKQNGGTLKFRLEDTDIERSKQEYSEDIVSGLKWLGIEIDYNNPYKQSEHGDTYKKYIELMLKNGSAYISKEEVKEEGQRAEVIRLKNPNKKIKYNDMIRGEIEVDTTELGDFIIAKSLTEPIYHLAVVVDDFEMGVTHIIRGEDGIYNTPRQILIQEAIGAPRPIYGHMPFILNEDRSKLSKRKQGELVSLNYYRKLGYLPQAMANFLALCGWNPGTEKEIFSMEELIKEFDILKVQKSGAIFNIEKLNWFNREHMKALPKSEMYSEIENRLQKFNPDRNIIERLETIILERIVKFSDIDALVENHELDYFFIVPEYEISKVIWKDSDVATTILHLIEISKKLESISEYSKSDDIKNLIWDYATEKGRGQVLWPLRYSLSGKDKSPDPFVLISVLGKTESINRINIAIKKLNDSSNK
jgi:glutamyl-tRNA synthetase